MLQNMGDAGGITRNRFKRDAERIFLVPGADMQVSGTRCRVVQSIQHGIYLFQRGHADDAIAEQLIVHGKCRVVGIGNWGHERSPVWV
jgi:hypothetical protein